MIFKYIAQKNQFLTTMERDFICGMVSGVMQTVIGHPFDTVKIRSQCGVRTPLKPVSYFNGMSYNLLSSVTCNAVIFGVQGNAKQFMDKNHDPSDSIIQHSAPGFLSGLCVAPLVFFFDIGKNKKQALGKKIQLSDFVQTRGATTTLIREPVAFAIYFSTYKTLTDQAYPVFWAGGLSGLACWAFTYPLDVVRNRQITYNVSLRDATLSGNLMKGFGVCLIRAFLVNSFGFYFFEKSKNLYDYLIYTNA